MVSCLKKFVKHSFQPRMQKRSSTLIRLNTVAFDSWLYEYVHRPGLWHSLMLFKQHLCGESPIRSCSRWAKPHLGVGRGCSIHDGLLHEVYRVSCVLRLLMELVYITNPEIRKKTHHNSSYWVGIKKCFMSSWVPCSIAIQHIKSCQGRRSASV